jgi:HAD superfamily hydrolase (TIGR01509 family)
MQDAAVFVDVDGTLVDSNFHHAIAWSRALRDHGENARLAAIHRLVGMGGSELLESLIGRDDDAIRASWREHFDQLLPEVLPFEGAAELLRAFHAHRVTVVLATSSPEDLLDVLRAKIGADDAIDVVVTAGDADQAKPHPDIFDTALEKSHADPGRVVVLGDSVWDVEAAKRAHLPCVGVETGGFSRMELEASGAVAVFRDPADLIARMAESPFNDLWT